MIPMMNSVFTIMENVRQARSLSPWPRIMATRALPPVPNMRPIAPVIIMAGQIRLRAAKGVVPVKFDTNRPSAMLYADMVSIISIDGSDERIILRYPQAPANSIFMYPYLIAGTKVMQKVQTMKTSATNTDAITQLLDVLASGEIEESFWRAVLELLL